MGGLIEGLLWRGHRRSSMGMCLTKEVRSARIARRVPYIYKGAV
jgi:hypothetical protein